MATPRRARAPRASASVPVPAPAGAPVPDLVARLREEFADFPRLDVLERRLVNPEIPTSVPIRLKDEPPEHEDPTGARRRWYLRWINTSMPNRFHTVKTQRGYVPVLWEELQDKEQISDRFEGAREVRRGDRGQEVLCKIPLPYYLMIKAREREALLKRAQSRTAMQDDLSTAAASRYGDEAAETVRGFVGEGVRELAPERETFSPEPA